MFSGMALFLTSLGANALIRSASGASRRGVAAFLHTEGDSENKKRIKKSPIYTRTGDAGTSSLYSGERRSKDDLIFHALGHQDELNAVLGIACEHCMISKNSLVDMLTEIQSRIFDLGAAVATPLTSSSDEKLAYTKFPSIHTAQLERWIDVLDGDLPKLTAFILPSGGLSASHLHLARTVCRRAERAVVPLVGDGLVDAEAGRYLNRLSDFLFVAARTAAMNEKREETRWKKVNPAAPLIN